MLPQPHIALIRFQISEFSGNSTRGDKEAPVASLEPKDYIN